MCDLEALRIDLKGLNEGETAMEFSLGDEFFEAMESPDINGGDMSLGLRIRRSGDIFELKFHAEGVVRVPCDVCLDDMDQPVETDNRLTAKLGDEYSEDEDLITVDGEDGTLDISWLAYEFIALGVPIKHAHEPSQCDPEMVSKLDEYAPTGGGEDGDEPSIDPRWSELEKLKTIIKD